MFTRLCLYAGKTKVVKLYDCLRDDSKSLLKSRRETMEFLSLLANYL